MINIVEHNKKILGDDPLAHLAAEVCAGDVDVPIVWDNTIPFPNELEASTGRIPRNDLVRQIVTERIDGATNFVAGKTDNDVI